MASTPAVLGEGAPTTGSLGLAASVGDAGLLSALLRQQQQQQLRQPPSSVQVRREEQRQLPVLAPALPFSLESPPGNASIAEQKDDDDTSPPSSIPLAMPSDNAKLSEYQILLRKQLELFVAQEIDVDTNTQGRKKQILLGQVGLRCRHCRDLPLRSRGRGAIYYPAMLKGIYQACQNQSKTHLMQSCTKIPANTRQQLITLQARRDTAIGGKSYWGDSCKELGVYESQDGCLRLSTRRREQQDIAGSASAAAGETGDDDDRTSVVEATHAAAGVAGAESDESDASSSSTTTEDRKPPAR